ncbi:hypothetical protein WAI453_013255 [Rhynchosporium graminicola]
MPKSIIPSGPSIYSESKGFYGLETKHVQRGAKHNSVRTARIELNRSESPDSASIGTRRSYPVPPGIMLHLRSWCRDEMSLI